MDRRVTDQKSADQRAELYCDSFEKTQLGKDNKARQKTWYACRVPGCHTSQGNVFEYHRRKLIYDHIDTRHFHDYRFLRLGKICDMCDHYEVTLTHIKRHQKAVHTYRTTDARGWTIPACRDCFSAWTQLLAFHTNEECPATHPVSKFQDRYWNQEKLCYVYKNGSNPDRLIAKPLDGTSFTFESVPTKSSSNDDSEGPDMTPEDIKSRLAQLRQELADVKLHDKHKLTHIQNLELEIKELENATRSSSREGSPSSSKSFAKLSPILTYRQRFVYGSSESNL
ncbi:hypothetical protein JCM3765_007194 [Sporobolomyces pararoseus]